MLGHADVASTPDGIAACVAQAKALGAEAIVTSDLRRANTAADAIGTALGLPVIVSDARPTARVVRDTGCGEVFQDRSVEDLARCIVALEGPAPRALRGGSG